MLALAGYLTWRLIGGLPGLVAATLPEFPEYPQPPKELSATQSGTIHFATTTPFDFDVILDGNHHAEPTTGIGSLTLPATASPKDPAPAVVILHGSGGIQPGREHEYAELLAANGIAAFVVDFYAPRGVTPETPYLLRVVSVTEFDAIADAYGARKLLATHPAIDGDRIGLMGFSYGGMAARLAMDERLRRVLAPEDSGFAAFAEFYGPCFQALGTQETNGAPLVTLRGTEDRSNDLAACGAREAELRDLGVTVESHVYAGAGHAWETETPRALREDSPYVAGCTVQYDARGGSSLEGTPIIDLPPETSRAERITVRMRSGEAMRDCVKTGYLIGRDDETHQKASAHLLDFLARTLAP